MIILLKAEGDEEPLRGIKNLSFYDIANTIVDDQRSVIFSNIVEAFAILFSKRIQQ